MRLFGKKKEEEIQEEKNHIKKIRDLRPENKRKRKEPPKPWGKKERFLILGILVITIISALFFSFSSQGVNLPNIPGLKRPLLNLNFLKGETIVINKNKEDEDKKSKEVVDQFNSLTGNLTGQYGLYVIRLDDDSSYGVKENQLFQGASLLKLPAMIALYRDSEDGNISLDVNYILNNSDKVQGAGPLYDIALGTSISYRDLAMYMGHDSDRTAYKVTLGILGEDKVKNILNLAGATHTDIESGETTPFDIGNLFQKLWEGSLVTNDDRDEILGFLTLTAYEDWLPKGVPTNLRVAHKVGEDDGILADAGIVFSPKPIIIVIMSEGANQDEASKVLPEISKAVYNIEIGGN